MYQELNQGARMADATIRTSITKSEMRRRGRTILNRLLETGGSYILMEGETPLAHLDPAPPGMDISSFVAGNESLQSRIVTPLDVMRGMENIVDRQVVTLGHSYVIVDRHQKPLALLSPITKTFDAPHPAT